MKVLFNLNASMWVKGIEIEADSEEAALDVLRRMTIEDMLEEGGFVNEMEISDVESEVISANYELKVTDISYDLSEDDVEVDPSLDGDEYDKAVEEAIENLRSQLPTEMTVDVLDAEDEDDLLFMISDEVADKVGYSAEGFEYEVLKKILKKVLRPCVFSQDCVI